MGAEPMWSHFSAHGDGVGILTLQPFLLIEYVSMGRSIEIDSVGPAADLEFNVKRKKATVQCSQIEDAWLNMLRQLDPQLWT